MWQLFCLAVLLLTTVESILYWEYGHDTRNLEMVHQIDGQIKPEEKNLYISLEVPKCIELKYVLVMVENHKDAPIVTYNMETKTVKISYKPQQISVSRYEITTKGKKISQCSDEEILKLRGKGVTVCEARHDYYRGVTTVGCGWGEGDNVYYGGYYDGYFDDYFYYGK